MPLKNSGSGIFTSLAGNSLLKQLFSKAGLALKGVYKTIVDATRSAFNREAKRENFSFKQLIEVDARKYSNPITLNTWIKKYAKQHQYYGILLQGQLFYFTYNDPLTKDSLEYYDTTPLVLSFGAYFANTGNIVEYAVNLHYLPKSVREAFLIDVFNMYRNMYKGEMHSSKLRPINAVTWETLKVFVDKYGIDFAVRSYLPERRLHTVSIDYQDWGKAICLPSSKFIGITDEALMQRYKLHLAERKKS